MESKWFVENSALAPVPKSAVEKKTPAARLARPSEETLDAPRPRYGLVGSVCGVGGLLLGFVVGLAVAFGVASERKQPSADQGVASASRTPVVEEKPAILPAPPPVPEPAPVVEALPAPREETLAVVRVEPQANDKPLVAAKPDALPPGELPKSARPTTDTCGTAVEFMLNPLEALEVAGKEKKLMFVMHISGNFEEAKFT
ncbi:hypothetical protein AYO44_02805 [Planctomycetaceae bacterium SCGC AG-212-F19]|nr:hypothetical protein AYO44_02805 [Planctomycetaceae bacterium SCGC AG-212-F19]